MDKPIRKDFMVMLTNMTKQIYRISIVLIQVTKSNFPTTATSKEVSPNDWDNDRQPEIAILPPKSEILYLNLTNNDMSSSNKVFPV